MASKPFARLFMQKLAQSLLFTSLRLKAFLHVA